MASKPKQNHQQQMVRKDAQYASFEEMVVEWDILEQEFDNCYDNENGHWEGTVKYLQVES